MKHWYMLTVVGKDRAGIVAHVTQALFECGANLGEASMLRLGGNFTIMLMVEFDGSRAQLSLQIEPVVQSLGLQAHIDEIKGALHHHVDPDVRITVYGADRAGIVAMVTSTLFEAGLDILNLDSDVAGTEQSPLYIMRIEGLAKEGIDALRSALDIIAGQGIDVHLEANDTVMG